MIDNNKNLNILVATGIFPPDIGGPSKYAQMLVENGNNLGYKVKAFSFSSYLKYPTGLRHVIYFIKILPLVFKSDFVIALDTFSVCLPAYFASKIFRKKIIVRTGGDFLWESYLNRTRDMIKLSDFYKKEQNFNFKEKLLFRITKFLLSKVDSVVFSTKYQMDIFQKAYLLDKNKCFLIENFYGDFSKRNIIPKDKILISPARDVFIKNKENILKAFGLVNERFKDVVVDFSIHQGEDFKKHLLSAYCVLIPSLSEISPNLAIDAVTLGIPVILTEDCGLKDRLDGFVVWVKPEDYKNIAFAVEKILDNKEYMDLISKLSRFEFKHSGEQIVDEFIEVYKKIK